MSNQLLVSTISIIVLIVYLYINTIRFIKLVSELNAKHTAKMLEMTVKVMAQYFGKDINITLPEWNYLQPICKPKEKKRREQ